MRSFPRHSITRYETGGRGRGHLMVQTGLRPPESHGVTIFSWPPPNQSHVMLLFLVGLPKPGHVVLPVLAELRIAKSHVIQAERPTPESRGVVRPSWSPNTRNHRVLRAPGVPVALVTAGHVHLDVNGARV